MIILLHLTRVDDVMCFKLISFLFLVQKKRLEVNIGEKWNLLSIVVNIGKSRQYCLNDNINDSLFIKWDKQEWVLSAITKPRLPLSFWILILWKMKVVLISVSSHTCQSLALLIETKTKKKILLRLSLASFSPHHYS